MEQSQQVKEREERRKQAHSREVFIEMMDVLSNPRRDPKILEENVRWFESQLPWIDVNYRYKNSWSFLHLACEFRCIPMANLLLACDKIAVNGGTYFRSPLELASTNYEPTILPTLLEDVRMKLGSAFEAAVKGGYRTAVKYLMSSLHGPQNTKSYRHILDRLSSGICHLLEEHSRDPSGFCP